MDFITNLPISTNWKRDNHDFILVIINWLTKMVHYKQVQITINIPGFVEVIINVVIWNHGLLDLIVTNKSFLFMLKFWLLLYYFFGINCRLFTAFYLQNDRQTAQQNSIMEVYLQAFVNFKQNDWVMLLLIAKFAYNNAKITSTRHTIFKLNCGTILTFF